MIKLPKPPTGEQKVYLDNMRRALVQLNAKKDSNPDLILAKQSLRAQEAYSIKMKQMYSPELLSKKTFFQKLFQDIFAIYGFPAPPQSNFHVQKIADAFRSQLDEKSTSIITKLIKKAGD